MTRRHLVLLAVIIFGVACLLWTRNDQHGVLAEVMIVGSWLVLTNLGFRWAGRGGSAARGKRDATTTAGETRT